MVGQTLPLGGGRLLIIRLVGEPMGSLKDILPSTFAVLLPAFDAEERRAAEAVVTPLVELGCIEFCCVGPQAEELHDAIDWVIEEKKGLHVVTTWDESQTEACEYFVHAAGGRPPGLLGLVENHPELVAALQQMARPVSEP